ncbi:MAG: universal stress protein [Actinobacteria bacterium]|nr:universal stress protein [Actinomycetota bacterium]
MFEKILLAVDGSEHSKRAADAAADIAKKSGGEVLVFHVREVEMGRGTYPAVETPSEAADLVNGVVHELHAAGVTARGDARSAPFGRAAHDIIDEAKTFGADVIVMGSRGLSDFSAMLVGSVAHKVIHLSECPVLVVK